METKNVEEKRNNKKEVGIIIVLVLIVLLIAFLIWFFNRKFDVKFDPNNGMEEYIVEVKYNKLVKEEDIKDADDYGEQFINWYKVIVDENGKETLEEKPFNFKETKIKEDIEVRAVYDAIIEPVEEPTTTVATTTTKATTTKSATTKAATTTAKPTTTTTTTEKKEDKLKISVSSSNSNCDTKSYTKNGDFLCEYVDADNDKIVLNVEPEESVTLKSNVPVTWSYPSNVTAVSKSSTNLKASVASMSSGPQTITATTAGGQEIKILISWAIK